jgi:hypothetical protein
MTEAKGPETKSIWKFAVRVTERFKVEMQTGAKVLCVQMQRGQPCMWAEVDTSVKNLEAKFFSVFGTGWPISNDYKGKYIGTFQVDSEAMPLVFHLYEDLP